jgi:hypothetical protein
MKIGDTVRLINNKDHLYHGKGIITKLSKSSLDKIYITVEHKSSNTIGSTDRYKLLE